MPFDADIVGHSRQLSTLRQALDQDRLHHAYVFLGPEGIGKKKIALSLAKAVHCLELTGDFCGGCENCVKIENQNHPDVRTVGLLPGKKDISIEQVRALEKELNYRAFSSRKKIVVIDPAPMMNFSAQNALLKTLEEPPAGSVLMMIATSAGGLLATLLSRCLRLSFAPLPASAVVDCLISRNGLKREQAELLAAVSSGSLGRALDPDTEELAREREAWLDGITSLSQEPTQWTALAEDIAKDREAALKFLEWLVGWYRDILIYRATENVGEICNLDMITRLKAEAEQRSLERTLFLRAQALRAAARIRRNVNRRMALENLFINLAELPK